MRCESRFPAMLGPRHDDICYATQNRQDAVRKLGQQCDLVLVVGSPNSSNSNRLRELAAKQGVPAHLVDGAQDIDRGVDRRERPTSGLLRARRLRKVSCKGVVDQLRAWGAAHVRELQGDPENMTFALPKELRVVVVD